MKILLTGGTGFIGKYLFKKLNTNKNFIYLLTRDKSKGEYLKISNSLFVNGDISKTQIFDNEDDLHKICEEVDIIVHAAGVYDFNANKINEYNVNILGTQNIIALAKKIKNLKHFYHISSIAVSGKHEGIFFEDELNLNAIHNSTYTYSKMVSEDFVRRSKLKCPITIFRPGIVIGDSTTGEIEKIDGPYYFLNLLMNNKYLKKAISILPYLPLPINEKTYLPIIPVDMLTEWIKIIICENNQTKNADATIKSYHLVMNKSPTLAEFLKELFTYLNFNPDQQIIPIKDNLMIRMLLPKTKLPKELGDFMYSKCVYDVSNRKKDFLLLPENEFHDFSKNIFDGFKKYITNQNN